MKDLLFVACTVGFFAVAIAYVWACDRLKYGENHARQYRPARDLHSDVWVFDRGAVVAGEVLT